MEYIHSACNNWPVSGSRHESPESHQLQSAGRIFSIYAVTALGVEDVGGCMLTKHRRFLHNRTSDNSIHLACHISSFMAGLYTYQFVYRLGEEPRM